MTPDDQSITAREAEAREARERGDFVGFVCCSHGRGRVLKVELHDERRAIRARCPVDGCAEGTHVTGNAMSRPRRRGEVCDTELIPDPTTPAAVDSGDPAELHGRQQVSDAAIFAAIPTDRAIPSADVGKAVGYVGKKATGLLARLRRMNKRAEDRGETPPFELTREPSTSGSGGRGRAIFVKRAEGTIT